ncbi:hypothetical protein BGW41_008057 [Actinomortierella wolfii]|nr:hypothetical protein BGW41_008057 [Actinomortierella wolfii]
MSRSILASGIFNSLKSHPTATTALPFGQLYATASRALGRRPAISAIAALHSSASRTSNRSENRPSISNLDFLDPPSKRHSNNSGVGSGSNRQGSSNKKTARSAAKQGVSSGDVGDPFDILDGNQSPKGQSSVASTPTKRGGAAAAAAKPTAPLDRPPRDEEIQAQWIQFINENGQNEGEKRLTSVLRTIDRKKFFLIQVDANTNPPICKLFSKSELFQKAKKEKQSKKANEIVTKELQLSWGTSDHDLSHKLSKFKGFLLKGYRVDIQITGRKGKSSTKEDRESMLEKIKAELEPDSKYVRPIAWTSEVNVNMLLQGNKKQ